MAIEGLVNQEIQKDLGDLSPMEKNECARIAEAAEDAINSGATELTKDFVTDMTDISYGLKGKIVRNGDKMTLSADQVSDIADVVKLSNEVVTKLDLPADYKFAGTVTAESFQNLITLIDAWDPIVNDAITQTLMNPGVKGKHLTMWERYYADPAIPWIGNGVSTGVAKWVVENVPFAWGLASVIHNIRPSAQFIILPGVALAQNDISGT